jgi:hypothetical protein
MSIKYNKKTVKRTKRPVLRHRSECQRAECKGAERQSAEFRENVTVPKRHSIDYKKCRNVTVSTLTSAETSQYRL